MSAKTECGHDIDVVVGCSVGSIESGVPIGVKRKRRVAGATRRGPGRGSGALEEDAL